MRFLKAHAWLALAAVAVLVAPRDAAAVANGCNISATPCSTACGGGCLGPTAITTQLADPCGGGGSFSLTTTQYAATCSQGGPVTCTGTRLVPPGRFWGYQEYLTSTTVPGSIGANSGCPNFVGGQSDWLINAELDLGITAGAGQWIYYQANWGNGVMDGCPSTGSQRTVFEISDVVAAGEGTINHGSWYVLGSVGQTTGYDIDNWNGATGTCGSKALPPVVLPAPSIPGVSVCQGGGPTSFNTDNSVDNTFFDVPVDIGAIASALTWYTETGRNGTPTLISGVEILYKAGTAPSTGEPTSSLATGWIPVRSVAGPATQEQGQSPLTPTSITVALPKGTPGVDVYWLAARVVYLDPTVNPTGAVALNSGPRVTSKLSAHCGPVTFGTTAVEYDTVEAERTPSGVVVRWSTLTEEDTLYFRVYRTTNPSGAEAVEATANPVLAVGTSGGGSSYMMTDTAITGHAGTTYYYYVQEFTVNGGFGTRSPVVELPAQASSQSGASGGRRRGSSRGR